MRINVMCGYKWLGVFILDFFSMYQLSHMSTSVKHWLHAVAFMHHLPNFRFPSATFVSKSSFVASKPSIFSFQLSHFGSKERVTTVISF